MMHALQVGMEWLPESPGSGVGRMVHGLIRHLPGEGIRVSGLVTGTDNLPDAPPQVTAFAEASDALPMRIWSLRRHVQTRLSGCDVDLLAPHFPLYTASLPEAPDGCPVVVHFHGPWAREADFEGESAWKVRVKRWVEEWAYARGTRFIVLSTAFCDELAERYDIARDRIDVVPGGVQMDRFEPRRSVSESRERLGWPADRPILVTVRRLVKRTGVHRLIDAMGHLRKKVPDVQLYIAGTGPQQDNLQARVEARSLSGCVEFLDFVPEHLLPLAYRAANLSVVPTIAHEGFGLVAIESLASGTPPVVTRVGGLPEVVGDLSEDLIVPDAAPALLADRLRFALVGRSHIPDARACRKYACKRYSWPVIARQVHDVYQKAT
ncbi:MAG TPA: glycosyltransferase family 4 protein [Longibacter sp.]